MAYIKQENFPCYLESLYFTIRVYLPTSFLHFKLKFCLKRRLRQEIIGDGNIITGHLFHSVLKDISGRKVDVLPPAATSFCCCNKKTQTESLKITQIYSLTVLEVRSPT